jgi:hypothetical protein
MKEEMDKTRHELREERKKNIEMSSIVEKLRKKLEMKEIEK